MPGPSLFIITRRCCDTDLQEAVGVDHDFISNSNILKKTVEHLMCYHHYIRSVTVTLDFLLFVIATRH